MIAIVEEHLAHETLKKIEEPIKSEKGQESEKEEDKSIESDVENVKNDKEPDTAEEIKELETAASQQENP